MLAIVLATALTSIATPSPSPDRASIHQSPSTNVAGFSIDVPRVGDVRVVVGEASRAVSLDAGLVAKLYADLERAGDLTKLPIEHCMKSASFGSSTTIVYGGNTSGDLQCAADTNGRALSADVAAIAHAALAGMPLARRRTMPIMQATSAPR
jgi:hypothetical protein